jgi:hypothetical protein
LYVGTPTVLNDAANPSLTAKVAVNEPASHCRPVVVAAVTAVVSPDALLERVTVPPVIPPKSESPDAATTAVMEPPSSALARMLVILTVVVVGKQPSEAASVYEVQPVVAFPLVVVATFGDPGTGNRTPSAFRTDPVCVARYMY